MDCDACDYVARNIYILALHKHGKHQDDSLMFEHGYSVPKGGVGRLKIPEIEAAPTLSEKDLEFERIYATGSVQEVVAAHQKIYGF